MSNNSSDGCVGGIMPAYDAPFLVPTLIVLLFTMSVMFLIHAKAFYDRVDLSHPVFAIVFQDIIVLSLCGLFNLIMMCFVAFIHSETVLGVSMVIGRFALHFHPVAWLVVTIERYYLLVLKSNSDENLNSLRRKGLIFVWLLFMPILVLTQGVNAMILIRHGWPKVPMRDFGASTGLMMSVSAILISNLPDLASVAIYFALWKHYKSSKNSEDGIPYGGIWVGEVHVEPPPAPMVVQKQLDSKQKIESVLKALQWHLKLCLIDLAFPIFTLFGCNRVIIYLMYPMQIVCYYWVPFFVIKNGFKQLDGVTQHVASILIFKIPQNNVVPNVPE